MDDILDLEARAWCVVELGGSNTVWPSACNDEWMYETTARTKYKLTVGDLAILEVKERRNPHYRSQSSRLYREADVINVAMAKHGGYSGLRDKILGCRDASAKRRRSVVQNQQDRKEFLTRELESRGLAWRNDSVLCEDFAMHGKVTNRVEVDRICRRMAEAKYLHEYCEFQEDVGMERPNEEDFQYRDEYLDACRDSYLDKDSLRQMQRDNTLGRTALGNFPPAAESGGDWPWTRSISADVWRQRNDRILSKFGVRHYRTHRTTHVLAYMYGTMDWDELVMALGPEPPPSPQRQHVGKRKRQDDEPPRPPSPPHLVCHGSVCAARAAEHRSKNVPSQTCIHKMCGSCCRVLVGPCVRHPREVRRLAQGMPGRLTE